MKVAVIGAGAAGLCCARHLSRYPETFQFQVLEKMNGIGGTWLYTPIKEPPVSNTSLVMDQDLVHSSVYKNLRVNTPKEIFFIPGFPFPAHLSSFPHHSEVLKYLQDYASHFQLNKHITCGMLVELITPVPHERIVANSTSKENKEQIKDSVKWKITTKNVKTGQRISEEYDAVLVCTGHFSAPRVPAIPGLPLFPRRVIHSHVYREPQVYRNQKVLIVGAGFSGQDISVDLSSHVKQVYLCNQGTPLCCSLPENVEELPAIAEVGSDGKVRFSNGQERLVDSIILATGYEYSFPFLSEDTGIRVENENRVTPLYKHTFNSVHPSMALIGMNFGYNPFQYVHYQVQWVLSVWAGDKTLPSAEDMIEEDEGWYQRRIQQGVPSHLAAHFFGSCHGEMINLMAKLGGNKPPDSVLQVLLDEIIHQIETNLMHYKSKNYVLLDKDKWAVQ